MLKILEKLPPKPHQIGRRGGLRYPYNATFRVECPECGGVYLTTAPQRQIERTRWCSDCREHKRRHRVVILDRVVYPLPTRTAR